MADDPNKTPDYSQPQVMELFHLYQYIYAAAGKMGKPPPLDPAHLQEAKDDTNKFITTQVDASLAAAKEKYDEFQQRRTAPGYDTQEGLREIFLATNKTYSDLGLVYKFAHLLNLQYNDPATTQKMDADAFALYNNYTDQLSNWIKSAIEGVSKDVLDDPEIAKNAALIREARRPSSPEITASDEADGKEFQRIESVYIENHRGNSLVSPKPENPDGLQRLKAITDALNAKIALTYHRATSKKYEGKYTGKDPFAIFAGEGDASVDVVNSIIQNLHEHKSGTADLMTQLDKDRQQLANAAARADAERATAWSQNLSRQELVKATLEGYAAFSPKMAEITRQAFDEGFIFDAPADPNNPLTKNRSGRNFTLPGPSLLDYPEARPYSYFTRESPPGIYNSFILPHELLVAVHDTLALRNRPVEPNAGKFVPETAGTLGPLLFMDKLRKDNSGDPAKVMAADRELLRYLDRVMQMPPNIAYAAFEKALFQAAFPAGGERKTLSADEISKLFLAANGDPQKPGGWWTNMPHFYSQALGYTCVYPVAETLALNIYREWRDAPTQEDKKKIADAWVHIQEQGSGIDYTGAIRELNKVLPPDRQMDPTKPEFVRNALKVVEGIKQEMIESWEQVKENQHQLAMVERQQCFEMQESSPIDLITATSTPANNSLLSRSRNR